MRYVRLFKDREHTICFWQCIPLHLELVAHLFILIHFRPGLFHAVYKMATCHSISGTHQLISEPFQRASPSLCSPSTPCRAPHHIIPDGSHESYCLLTNPHAVEFHHRGMSSEVEKPRGNAFSRPYCCPYFKPKPVHCTQSTSLTHSSSSSPAAARFAAVPKVLMNDCTIAGFAPCAAGGAAFALAAFVLVAPGAAC